MEHSQESLKVPVLTQGEQREERLRRGGERNGQRVLGGLMFRGNSMLLLGLGHV